MPLNAALKFGSLYPTEKIRLKEMKPLCACEMARKISRAMPRHVIHYQSIMAGRITATMSEIISYPTTAQLTAILHPLIVSILSVCFIPHLTHREEKPTGLL